MTNKKIIDFLKTLSKEEIKDLVGIVNLITDPLSQELIKKAAEDST